MINGIFFFEWFDSNNEDKSRTFAFTFNANNKPLVDKYYDNKFEQDLKESVKRYGTINILNESFDDPITIGLSVPSLTDLDVLSFSVDWIQRIYHIGEISDFSNVIELQNFDHKLQGVQDIINYFTQDARSEK